MTTHYLSSNFVRRTQVILLHNSAMKPASAASALKVQAVLGDHYKVLEFDAGTRTAADAAAAIGCTVAQIAKSLIFRTRDTNRTVLVVASGPNRVDEKKIATEIGERIVHADADFVREATGFAISRPGE